MKTLMLLIMLTTLASAATSPSRERSARLGEPGEGVGHDIHSVVTNTAQPAVRFASVDVMIDTKDEPLAVYQLEFSATKDTVQIVGIEGSSHEAFREPPYFDPQAIQQERVILAAFNTAAADNLPRGKVRLATIHLQITGDVEPVYQIKPSVIATVDGKAIQATVTVENKRMPL